MNNSIIEYNFNPTTLVQAIKSLFELNNYDVKGPIQIYGAEIDLVAKNMADPFAPNIYIEATVEYVSNEKYGKDLTKFALVKEKDPSGRFLLVSSKGFTISVVERATETRIDTYTYDALFKNFQQFGKYVDFVLNSGEYAHELNSLVKVYEKAYFNDINGKNVAFDFLNDWVTQTNPKYPWIVVVGDYGTGKTALTKVMQSTWVEQYKNNPNLPIPFRIELREFSKQFDARGLLHHFLDSNKLTISVDFVFDLIRKGKIVLLLDGYDEMAQYMHVRERRNCLATLAKLSKDGARGILTSRPNYFTISEELNILDAFYTQIEVEKKTEFGRRSIEVIIEKEKEYDELLKRLIDRYERNLQDLDEKQTKHLVSNMLKDDEEGKGLILKILDSVFRGTGKGDEVSLSGKPVIISYLLEVIDEIKRDKLEIPIGGLNEWEIFDYIILKLMLRDFRRADLIIPDDRRHFLRLLSIECSSFSNFKIGADDFKKLINDFFQNKFKVIQLTDEREKAREQYFADLRSSATLTRSLSEDYWQFSHNSLREFLSSEYYYQKLIDQDTKMKLIPITDVMQMFILSLDKKIIKQLAHNLRDLYLNNLDREVFSHYLKLLWLSFLRLYENAPEPVSEIINYLTNGSKNLTNVFISRLNMNMKNKQTSLENLDISSSFIQDCEFANCLFDKSNFSDNYLSSVRFFQTSLKQANFSNSVLEDVDFSNVDIQKADFSKAEIKLIRYNDVLYVGKDAQGILTLNGAIVEGLEPIYTIKYHKNFDIAEKISARLLTQSYRQIRGLVQRGTAAKNSRVAKEFLDLLISLKYAEINPGRKDLVKITELGRKELINLVELNHIPDKLLDFFS